ncbi:MAG: SusC/RagA family TonB-linked outer membrane protein, partial [Chitinophagaceae bacterium]|nr:SusC/RagA family TonB-linked outer membrane protein [Chitinophagaceae bacterium]
MRKMLLLVATLLLLSWQLYAQSRTVTGRVTDEKGIPIPNASVIIKGTASGTSTDADGNFSIAVAANAKTLVITAVNFASQDINITGKNSVKISMVVEDKNLTEVVVVGYQSFKKTEVTGSVATVSGKEVSQKPIGSFTQLLQGRATGVQVTGQSGRPGANGYIRVRGTGSINASNEPLILLDGVPISSTAYSLLNPNDIEDLNVLKDASSQAIYGARGSNGVILVTTKKGRGKPELRYSFQYGIMKAQDLNNIDFMSAAQKLQYEYEAGRVNPMLDSMIKNRVTSGALPAGSTLFNISDTQRGDLWGILTNAAPDWRKTLLPNGRTVSHEVALTGTSDKIRYFFSLNKSDNDGVSYGSYWNRTGGRLNIEYNALSWFRLGTNLGVSYTKENNVRSLYNSQSANTALYLINPYEPVFLANGKFNPTHTLYSPLEGTVMNPSLLNRISTFSTLFGEANLLKNLTLKTQLGINYNTLQQENYLMPGSNLAGILGYNQKLDAGNRDFTYVFTNTANWKQTIADVHSLNVLVGQEFTKNAFYSYSFSGRGMPTGSVNTIDNAGSPGTVTSFKSDWSLLSYFGNLIYDYDKKYFATFTARRDGSSRFGANKRYANFWAIGLTWDITKESFFKSNIVSELKLRGSYGTAGTVPTGLYDNLGTYALTAKYSDAPAATPARLSNADLTWESSKSSDIGLDFGFLKSRITGSVDVYKRITDNLLYPKNVSLTTGFSGYTSNVGSLENKGIEISLNGTPYKSKDVTINLFFSYTYNQPKFKSLYADNQDQTLSRFVVGEAPFTYYLNRWAGVNPSNGKNLFLTKNGDLTEKYSSDDAVLLKGKSPQVKFFGSFGGSVSYKGFDLNALFYYSGGNYIMNYVYATGASDGEGVMDQQFTDALNYWKKPGDIVQFTNVKDPANHITYDTDKYLERGDYVNLRDIVLAYNIPSEWAAKAKLKGVRVFAQGTNLLMITKFKGIPEVGEANGESTLVTPGLYNLFAQPPMKAFTFGV